MLGVIALLFGSGTVQAAEPATRPCSWPENGQEIGSVWQIRPRPSGVWVATLDSSAEAPLPGLLGTNDAGRSWTYHCTASIGGAESIFFLDERVGWATILEAEHEPRAGATVL